MLEANIKIIDELKSFVRLVTDSEEGLDLFRVSGKDFTRKRKLPFATLVLLIAKLCKKTLSIELETFFEEIKMDECCSVSAFSQQRLKLKPDFFYYWNMVLWNSFYAFYGAAVKRWGGYRVIAADGSSVSLVNTPCFEQYFGGQSNQNGYFCIAKTFYYYDVLNELILFPQIAPYSVGELPMAYQAIDAVEPDMLMIYDRNFCNYKMIALHLWQETERKFIIRGNENQLIIRKFIKSGVQSAIADWPPTVSAMTEMPKSGYKITKNTTLRVRLVRVELPTTVEVLVTNLWEEDGHPCDEFKDLYFMRWGVETNIAVQKNILQLEAFSGLTVESVLQDFFATTLLTNLHSLLIKEAQQTVDQKESTSKYSQKINKNKSFGRLKASLVKLFIENDTGTILQSLYDCFVKDTLPIRKGRSFKRVRKNPRSKSKHRTFTNYKPSY